MELKKCYSGLDRDVKGRSNKQLWSLVIGLPREIPDRDSVAYFAGVISHWTSDLGRWTLVIGRWTSDIRDHVPG